MEKERLTSNNHKVSCRICNNSKLVKITNNISDVNRNYGNNISNAIKNSYYLLKSNQNSSNGDVDCCNIVANTRKSRKSNIIGADSCYLPDGSNDRSNGGRGPGQGCSTTAFHNFTTNKNIATAGKISQIVDNDCYICKIDPDTQNRNRIRVNCEFDNDRYNISTNNSNKCYICNQDGEFCDFTNNTTCVNGDDNYSDLNSSKDASFYNSSDYNVKSNIESSFCSKCNESIMSIQNCELCRNTENSTIDILDYIYNIGSDSSKNASNASSNKDFTNNAFNDFNDSTGKSPSDSLDFDTEFLCSLSGISDSQLFIGESAAGVNGEFPGVWNELRLNDQLCDGVIKCRDGRSVKIHRAILSAVSPYFRAIFTNSLRAGCDEETQITVDIESTLLESLLDYAYTGMCTVTSDNVEALLPAADQYEVLGVINLCCQYLFNELRPENCLGILRFAKHYFCRELEYNAMHYTLINFKRVMQESSEFAHLQFQELSAILRDDELNVRTEESVVEAIKAWTEFDRKTRVAYVPELLTTVRFGLMSFKYFTSHVFKWDVIQHNVACQEALYPASIFLTELNSRECSETDLNDPLARPRIPNEILFAIGGWSAGSPTSFVETYDVRSDRWFLSVSTDVTPRAYHGVCTLDNLIYMVGGFDGNEHFNTVRCFNPLTKIWRERACMYHARCYVSVVAHDGWVYAMGGYNGRTRMCSVERYDPNRNQWEMVTPMNKQRSDASAASLKNKIYVVGGFNGSEVLVSGEVYDPSTLQWTFIPQMLNPRSGVSLVAYRGALYALGGFSGFSRLNSGEKFDPDGAGDWSPIADMFSPRSNFATVVIDEMIYAIGGFNGTTTIAYVECYEGDANEWYDAACMNLNRSALSACVLKGLPNGRDYSYLTKAQEHEQGGGPAKSHKRHIVTSR